MNPNNEQNQSDEDNAVAGVEPGQMIAPISSQSYGSADTADPQENPTLATTLERRLSSDDPNAQRFRDIVAASDVQPSAATTLERRLSPDDPNAQRFRDLVAASDVQPSAATTLERGPSAQQIQDFVAARGAKSPPAWLSTTKDQRTDHVIAILRRAAGDGRDLNLREQDIVYRLMGGSGQSDVTLSDKREWSGYSNRAYYPEGRDKFNLHFNDGGKRHSFSITPTEKGKKRTAWLSQQFGLTKLENPAASTANQGVPYSNPALRNPLPGTAVSPTVEQLVQNNPDIFQRPEAAWGNPNEIRQGPLQIDENSPIVENILQNNPNILQEASEAWGQPTGNRPATEELPIQRPLPAANNPHIEAFVENNPDVFGEALRPQGHPIGDGAGVATPYRPETGVRWTGAANPEDVFGTQPPTYYPSPGASGEAARVPYPGNKMEPTSIRPGRLPIAADSPLAVAIQNNPDAIRGGGSLEPTNRPMPISTDSPLAEAIQNNPDLLEHFGAGSEGMLSQSEGNTPEATASQVFNPYTQETQELPGRVEQGSERAVALQRLVGAATNQEAATLYSANRSAVEQLRPVSRAVPYSSTDEKAVPLTAITSPASATSYSSTAGSATQWSGGDSASIWSGVRADSHAGRLHPSSASAETSESSGSAYGFSGAPRPTFGSMVEAQPFNFEK